MGISLMSTVPLINPEKKVPYRITQLTGINTQMVQDAPYFYEIAKKVVEITEGRTFVAHNASFDYRFIQAEFARYGFDEASQQISQLEADPNPFSSTTNIHFQLFKAGQVGLSIYDIAGKEIFSSGNEWKSQGDQFMNWNGQNSQGNRLDEGIYFYRIQSAGQEKGGKLIFLP